MEKENDKTKSLLYNRASQESCHLIPMTEKKRLVCFVFVWFGMVWFGYFFNGKSTIHELSKAEMWFISECLMTITTIFSMCHRNFLVEIICL